MRITDELLNGLFVIYFAVFVMGAYFNWRARRQVRKFHPETWAALGSPSISNNSVSNSFKFVRFLIQQKYETLNDVQLNFYGAGARLGLLSIAGFLALFVILILIGQYQNGVWSQPAVVKGPNGPGIAIMGCVLLYLLSFNFFLTRLKNRHRQTWEALGEPSFLNQSLSNQSKLLGFFLSGRYLQLKDTILSFWAAVIWLLFLIFVWLVWIH